MRLATLQESLIHIDQYDSKNRGSLDGYVVDTNTEQLENYLYSFSMKSGVISDIREKYDRIAIIKNLHVDDDHRGIGLGNKLLSDAIDEAYDNGAEAIIIIADMEESNKFDIQRWYESFGFEKITNTDSGPLMILAEE